MTNIIKFAIITFVVRFNSVICRCGGTGRRPGLKIPWEEIPVPVRPRSSALKKTVSKLYFEPFFCILTGDWFHAHVILIENDPHYLLDKLKFI